ncbi:hypothetical protein NCC49_002503 [Naganishia albida]|nr:hypothetical protein NCC49_002503 [Naganishia albida]
MVNPKSNASFDAPLEPFDTPATPARPRTTATRPRTARLEPFHADHLPDEEYHSESDEDVFAFERPITAAAPPPSPASFRAPTPIQEIQDPSLPMHTRNPSSLSAKPSLISAASYTTDGFTTDATSEMSLDPNHKSIRMRTFCPRAALASIPGSREGTDPRRQSSTVPDGRTTRGGGGRPWSSEASRGRQEVEQEDSPYEEVRASVSNIDDVEMPALTWRVWFLGLLFLVIRSGMETVFQFRSPSASFPLLSIQLFVYPLGKLLAHLLPLKIIHLPFSLTIDLNPGPFNIKENTLIIIMANVVVCPALHATTAAEMYLGAKSRAGFMTLFILGSELAGLGLAGLGHRVLVEPASMIWPSNLVTSTFLNTFHAEEEPEPGRWTRFRFFMVAFAAAFAYCFLPSFLFTALSYFSWVCWIKPESRVLNNLFGVTTGLGMGLFTFDWSQILYVGSPLTVPWWAQANAIVGFVMFYWIICPILYYNNVWYSAYMPISTGAIMDRFGLPYNITSILSGTSIGHIDETAYHAYSPVYISITFAMTWTLAFALSTAAITHTILYHGGQIWRAMRHRQVEEPDVHAKLMRSYPKVPFWWFAGFVVLGFALSIVAIEVFHTGYPVYMLLVSFLIPVIYFFPSGFLLATATQSLAINVMSQLLPGYLVSGNAVVNMLSKAYSLQTLITSNQITTDMKLGHYLKIAHKDLLTVQLSALIATTMTQIAVREALFFNISDICTMTQKDSFSCPLTSAWFRSSILWGSLGPDRVFGSGALYHPSVYAAVAGIFLPIPLWLLGRHYKRSIWRKVDSVVLFNSLLGIPPANGVNYASFLIVGFVFQYLIRRKAFRWWSRFNYILSAALDMGTLLAIFVIFLALGLANVRLEWAGNTIHQRTYDWIGMSYLDPPAQGFGSDSCE